MSFLCHDEDPDHDSDLMCNAGRFHPGDHVVTDGEGGKILAEWPRDSLPMPLEIDELPDVVIVSAMRLPFDPICHESWIIVGSDQEKAARYSTHLVNYHRETSRFVASNGHYDLPNLVVATVDAFDRFKKGI